MEYKHLNQPNLPKLVKFGLTLMGVKEIVGRQHNHVILQWAKDLNISNYTNDEIPWCGLAVAKICQLAGRPVVTNPLWARNWAKWGVDGKVAILGDILVFSRKAGGHVGLYIAEDEVNYHVMGGNQANAFNIILLKKERCIAIRRPIYKNIPATCKRYFSNVKGVVSENEA